MISNSLPFFHPYVSSFFFPLAFCPPHTYTHRIPSSLFFLYIPLDSWAFLSHYFSSSLILCFFFLFLFLLDSINSLALSVILDSIILLAFLCHYLQTHTDTHGEKGEIVFAPAHHHRCSSSSLRSACNQGFISASIFFPCSWLVFVSDFRFVKSASIFFFLDHLLLF